MLKKPLLLVGIFGGLLIIGGFIFNPSFFGHFTHDGKVDHSWALIGIFLVQFYMITVGGIIIIESIIFNFLPTEKRIAQFFLGICVIGLVIIASGALLNPAYIEHKLNLFKVEDDRFALLCNIQLGIITFGFLIAFISLLLYRGKLAVKKFVTIFLAIIILIYFILADKTFVNAKYPSNILLKPNEYGKVVDLLLGRDILLSDFSPRSPLKLHRTQILKAKYPVIDINFHFHSAFMTKEDKRVLEPKALIKTMDSIGIKMIVGYDATDSNLDYLLGRYQRKYPDRFLVGSDMLSGNSRILTNEFIASLPLKLEKFNKLGMRIVGEWTKDLGLKMKDTNGKLIPSDDPRFDHFYDEAGVLRIPLVWHATDPTQFFQPVDKFNERYLELSKRPFWSYAGPQFPSKETILKQREKVLKKHPNTIFIGCHLGFNPDNLDYCAYLLDTYPNYYVELSTVLSDLGREPYTARKFFIKYQDRILFGSDGGNFFGVKGWTIEKYYRTYFEFLETDNEYFDYPLKGAINQGNWEIYGINLPDEVLEKIYYKNAEKILFKNKDK